MKKKNSIKIFLFLISFLHIGISCTKLDTNVYDQVTNFWQTPDQIAAGVAPAYSGLRNYAPANNVFSLNEVSTDEVIVPIRGGDWNDNGNWEKLWKHTWKPDHPQLSDTWEYIYSSIARVNSILQTVNAIDPKPNESASIIAELKTIRAFYNYLALDPFGNVPIVENNNTDLSQLGNKSRTEVFSYVVKEIKDNLTSLTTEVNLKTYGRATQWFAQSILAKLYLNALVYTGTPRWAECIATCDAILNSNKYSLESNFFNNFLIANEGSKENIFVIPFDRNAGLNYFWVQAATLHYTSNRTFGLDFGGFNGFCSTAEYYNIFSPNDVRRKMFLVGQQYVNQIMDSAHIQYDTDVNLPLIFDPVIKSFSNPGPVSRMSGARCAKWEYNKQGGGLMSNDFAVYRLADIILMKAEAQFRNGDITAALATINQKINGVSIRNRTGLPDFDATEMNLDGLLKERARELSWEGWRRNDLIRFNHYTDARIPEKAVSQNFRILYPIPASALAKNPYLVQNPGY
jgi:hypothetical protein